MRYYLDGHLASLNRGWCGRHLTDNSHYLPMLVNALSLIALTLLVYSEPASAAPSSNGNTGTKFTPPAQQYMELAGMHVVSGAGMMMVGKGVTKAVSACEKCRAGDHAGAAKDCSDCAGCVGHGGALFAASCAYGRARGHFD